jgi:hypothetical protein
MSGDYTRFSFDPTKGFSGVHEQQGRVSLDSDANEFEEILDRRDRSEMYDTVGAAVVPATTPTGFEIGVSGSSLTIGIGRVYVDGIQAECFGDLSDPKATVFEPRVGSVVGNLPLLFDQQPFLYQPNFPGLPSASGITSLVYLDVWQREVTVWEDRSLLEPALGGPDTATRIQTTWQVKSLAGVAGGDCTLPTALIAPSTARMTAIAAPAPPAPGPCVIAPAGGYTGLENRLYRVEVQHAGTLAGPNPATIKWSRDNASLVASVLKVTADGTGSIITVESTGRDTWMRFEVGQQLELLDDWVEFAMRESGVAGEIARITNINHATGEIRIDQDFSAFAILATRHPRVRRWDTAKPADPAVVAVNNGTPIALEHGIFITFGDLLAGTLHDGDTLHAGDYWVFAARTADGSIEAVLNEPPRGILHHFMPLAIVTSGNPPIVDSDCRDPWPVLCNCEGGGCECDACVSVESHTSGSLTIQMAVDQVVAAGGGTVCIGVGTFPLEKTVLIENAVSLRVRGAGLATILWYRGQDPALVVRSSLDVIVRDLAVITERERSQPQDAVEVIDAALIILERLVVIEDPIAIIEFLDAGTVMRASGGAIGLGGFILRTTVRDCVLAGGIGILSRPNLTKEPDDYLVTADLLIEHDLIFATAFGVWLGSPEESGAVHFLDRTQIADCSIYGCEQVGIMLSGTVTRSRYPAVDGPHHRRRHHHERVARCGTPVRRERRARRSRHRPRRPDRGQPDRPLPWRWRGDRHIRRQPRGRGQHGPSLRQRDRDGAEELRGYRHGCQEHDPGCRVARPSGGPVRCLPRPNDRRAGHGQHHQARGDSRHRDSLARRHPDRRLWRGANRRQRDRGSRSDRGRPTQLRDRGCRVVRAPGYRGQHRPA